MKVVEAQHDHLIGEADDFDNTECLGGETPPSKHKVVGWYREGKDAGMTPDQILRLIWNLESSGTSPAVSDS